MNITLFEKLYFIGVGGIGMSALARYFNSKGLEICGYDKTPSELTNQLQEEGIDIPVHIGIAGPAKLQTLIKYSVECGVGASIKVLQKRAKDITKLLKPYKPDTVLKELALYKNENPSFNIQQVHFFPLGGIKQVTEYVEGS